MRSIGSMVAGPVRGMAGLTSAMTVRACSAAASVTSTVTPRLHLPSSSGGATCTSATSTRCCPRATSDGTSDSETGT